MTFKVTGQPNVVMTLNANAPGGQKTIESTGKFAQHVDKLAVNKVKADLSSRLDRVWLVVLKGIESLGGNTSAAQKVVSNRLARNVINRLNDEPIKYPNGTQDLLGNMLVNDLGIDLDKVQFDDGFNALLKTGLDSARKEIIDNYYAAIEPDILGSINLNNMIWKIDLTDDHQIQRQFIRYCIDMAANFGKEDKQEAINLDTVVANIANAFWKLENDASSKGGNEPGTRPIDLVNKALQEFCANGKISREELLYPNEHGLFPDLARALNMALMV